MPMESYQPDYGPTEYDLDFNFELDFSVSDYLIIGVYFVFILPVLTLLRLVQYLIHKVKDIIAPAHQGQEERVRSHGLLSFVSKIF